MRCVMSALYKLAASVLLAEIRYVFVISIVIIKKRVYVFVCTYFKLLITLFKFVYV